MTDCALCNQPIQAGQPRIAWFTKDDGNEVSDTGTVHLAHLQPPSTVTYKPTK